MGTQFRKGRSISENSPYLQILFPVKRCGKSGGNGYEPANGFPNAAALRGREEMVQEK